MSASASSTTNNNKNQKNDKIVKKIIMPFVEHGGLKYLEDNKNNNLPLCIISVTGSGKSSTLAEFYAKQGQRTFMFIPGRAATRSLFEFMTSNRELSHLYAYSIGGKENEGEANAPMRMVTGGWGLAKFHDPSFIFDTFILDEAHTPSADYYLLRKIAKKKLAEGHKFKMILCSATITPGMFASDFPNMQEPFDLDTKTSYNNKIVHHTSNPFMDHEKDVIEICKVALQMQLECPEGDKLIFCDGESTVIDVAFTLESRLGKEIRVVSMYGAMEPSELREALSTKYNGVTIFVGTNMVESSITIPGITHVICSGMQKTMYVDGSGRKCLRKELCSQSSLLQQRGRGMRTVVIGKDGNRVIGYTYMMMTSKTWDILNPSAPREVDTSALHEPIMQLLGLGYSPEELMDDISPQKIYADKEYLLRFGLLEYKNKDLEEHLTDELNLILNDNYISTEGVVRENKLLGLLGLNNNNNKNIQAQRESVSGIVEDLFIRKSYATTLYNSTMKFLLEGDINPYILHEFLTDNKIYNVDKDDYDSVCDMTDELYMLSCNNNNTAKINEVSYNLSKLVTRILKPFGVSSAVLNESIKSLMSYRTDLPIVTDIGKAVTSITTDIPGARSLYKTAIQLVEEGYPDMIWYAAFMEARKTLLNGPFHYPKSKLASAARKNYRFEFAMEHFMQYYGRDDMETSLTVYRMYMTHHNLDNKILKQNEKYNIDNAWLHEKHLSGKFFETMRRNINMLLSNLRQLGMKFQMYDINRSYSEISCVLWPIMSVHKDIFTLHKEAQRNGSIRNIFRQTAAVASVDDRLHEMRTVYSMDGWNTINQSEHGLPSKLIAFNTASVAIKDSNPFYTMGTVFGIPKDIIVVEKLSMDNNDINYNNHNINIPEHWDRDASEINNVMRISYDVIPNAKYNNSSSSSSPPRGIFSQRGRGGNNNSNIRGRGGISAPSAMIHQVGESYSPLSGVTINKPDRKYPIYKRSADIFDTDPVKVAPITKASAFGGRGRGSNNRGNRGGSSNRGGYTAPASYSNSNHVTYQRPPKSRFSDVATNNIEDSDNEY